MKASTVINFCVYTIVLTILINFRNEFSHESVFFKQRMIFGIIQGDLFLFWAFHSYLWCFFLFNMVSSQKRGSLSPQDVQTIFKKDKICEREKEKNQILCRMMISVFIFMILIEGILRRKGFFINNMLNREKESNSGKYNNNAPFVHFLYNLKDFYLASNGCISENISQGRSYLNIAISISDCFFLRSSLFTGSGGGGVIYVNGGSLTMNISYTMFYQCSCSSDGGAIYYASLKSFLNMICSCNCSATTNYQFAYLKASSNNEIWYVSISYCSHSGVGSNAIVLTTGNQKAYYSNSSLNKAVQASGMHFSTATSYVSSFCTCSNNYASNSICVYFYSNSGTMSYANIVHNNSPGYGIVFVWNGGPKVYYSIFDMNQNALFCIYAGTLTVSHCFISHSGSFSASRSVSSSINNTFTRVQTYQIQFFNSHYCNADIPLINPDQTILSTPEKTLEKTIDSSIINTIEETPTNTFDQTIVETPISTFDQRMNVSDQTSNESNFEASSMTVLTVLSVIAALIGSTYGIGFIMTKKMGSSDIDSESFDHNFLDII